MATTLDSRRNAHGHVEDLGIVDSMVQLSFLVHSVLNRVAARYEVSIVLARLVGVLRDREPTMGYLARVLELDKSSVSGLVDRAERRGLVRRITSLDDGRSVRVALTGTGRRLAREFSAQVEAQLLGAVGPLSEPDRRRLSALASTVVIASFDEDLEDAGRATSAAPHTRATR